MSQPLFARRTTIILVVISVVSLAAAVSIILLGNPRAKVTSFGNDTFSYSALGHRALVDLLDELGIPVLISRYDTLVRTQKAGLLIAAEPQPGDKLDASDSTVHRQATTLWELVEYGESPLLVVLPKRSGYRSWTRDGWVESVRFVDIKEVRNLMGAMDIHGEPVRLEGSNEDLTWTSGPYQQVPKIDDLQLLPLSAAEIEPIIFNEAGTLLGRLASDKAVYVLSDPDLIATHGLHEPANARLAVSIIDHLRDGGVVVFDEVLHGYELKPSLTRRLLEFPLVLALIQVLLLLILWLWAGVGRFGAPRAVDLGLRPGSAFFIDNTARLLRFGGHSGHMLDRYLWLSFQKVALKLHAPPGLARKPLVQWLTERSQARGLNAPLWQWALKTEDMSISPRKTPPHQVVALALAIYRWKSEILHGT